MADHGIDVIQATAFCGWIDRRLPTRTEWQAAATASGRYAWPWSDDPPTPERAVLQFQLDALPQQVGSRGAAGMSADGVNDLIGNVWELTRTAWQTDLEWAGSPRDVPDGLTAMGGAYTSGPGATAPLRVAMSARDADIGFRCVEAR